MSIRNDLKVILEDYRQRENDGRALLSIEQEQAFVPPIFIQEAIPFRLGSERGLWKYADSMQTNRARETYESLLGANITPSEFELLDTLSSLVKEITFASSGMPVIPIHSLLRALNTFRFVAVEGNLREANVLEIGPGSAHFSAMCINAGVRNIFTLEISEAFAIWQRMYLDAISSKQATPNSWVPWDFWDFARGILPEKMERIDLVVANHMWTEMTPASRRFTLHQIHGLLDHKHSQSTYGQPLLVFEGWGMVTKNNPSTWQQTVLRDFEECGFKLIHNSAWITILLPVENHRRVTGSATKSLKKSVASRTPRPIRKCVQKLQSGASRLRDNTVSDMNTDFNASRIASRLQFELVQSTQGHSSQSFLTHFSCSSWDEFDLRFSNHFVSGSK